MVYVYIRATPGLCVELYIQVGRSTKVLGNIQIPLKLSIQLGRSTKVLNREC